MKQETKVFVTADADFCLLLRGEEKKLMSFEEVEEKLIPYALYPAGVYGMTVFDRQLDIMECLLTSEHRICQNFAIVCEKFKHILWPETQTA